MHVGHRRIMAAARELSARLSLPIAAIIPPDNYKDGIVSADTGESLRTAPSHRLMTDAERFFTLRQEGASIIITGEMCLDAAAIVCGEGSPFAQNPAAYTIPLVRDENGNIVSGELIKKLLSEGNTKSAARLLGANYSFEAEILHGARIGHQIGVPTINQRIPKEKFCPKKGVYFVRVNICDATYNGVCNLGVKPTVSSDADDVICETHLFDCSCDFYGIKAKTEILYYCRSEKKFATLDELRAVIEADIAAAKEFFATSQKSNIQNI
jgi:hypothetical protein